MMNAKALFLAGGLVLISSDVTFAGALKAPPGLFKDLHDEILDDAIILNGKQLFIDNHIIGQLDGVNKRLNQPTKHARNPLLIKDKAWEDSGPGYGTVLYDADEGIFKMWYGFWIADARPSEQVLCYATSKDGLHWIKPIVNEDEGTNAVDTPDIKGFQSAGIMKDPVERDPARRYKMLFSAAPDGTPRSWLTSAAFSHDGIHWRASDPVALIPFSDTQICPYWDPRRGRYVAIIRYGPPNSRLVDRIESEDFLHWSPKVRVINRTRLDQPLSTVFYQMAPMPYEGVTVGLIAAYHSETLAEPPEGKPWVDRKNLHLAFSRNGVTWSRVGRHGAIPQRELSQDKDWKQIALGAAFVPYGRKSVDWDWGTVSPYFTPDPIVVGDRIFFYYIAQNGRNWWTHAGDPPKLDPDAVAPTKGVGLATLRLDGFVSVEGQGTLTTRTLLFIGDQIEVNADASGGSIRVEAVDPNGDVIEGFARQDCAPITTDSVRHVLQWNDNPDCHLLQARPIKLRFHLNKAKLYSFTPRIRHTHFVPSYD
ncbi:MAG: hypothetical protein CMJ18_04490 [Phycisphaeraceae bacterium]|nr:hypothetical protein [Phycisphaeraceae bacterium]